jgi:hypothetical protein
MRIVLPGQSDPFRATSPLNELVLRLARLAAPYAYSMTARLVGDKDDASRIELKATRMDPGQYHEYACQVTLSTLERDGADAVAREFARDARRALANGCEPDREMGSSSKARR